MNQPYCQNPQTKLASIIARLKEEPVLRYSEIGKDCRIGHLLDKCGKDRSAQKRFAFELEAKCGGKLPPVAVEYFGNFTLGQLANALEAGGF